MVESEAKKKWCPFADSGYMWQGFNGKVDEDSISPKCLASNCMAWIETNSHIIIKYCEPCKDNYKVSEKRNNCPKCNTQFEQGRSLNDDELEGYCQRLKSGS